MIKRCINPVAYEVDLPPDSKIHPVFHVSQMRRVLKSGMPLSVNLPVFSDIPPAPVKILGHRWRHTPTGRREQLQVQWPPDSSMDTTWEDRIELQQQFPELLAWGQANSQGTGDVSTSTTEGGKTGEMGLTLRRVRPKRLIQPNRRHLGPDWTT